MFTIDQKFPNFSLEVYNPSKDELGRVSLNTFKKKWLVLFFYPADFTFVCPTEIVDLNRRHNDFKKLGAEIVVASTDTVFSHKAWIEAEEILKGLKCVMAADHNGKVSQMLGIYDEEKGLAQRAAFIIDPDGILRSAEIVADAIGRNAGEIVRKIKALKFVREHTGHVCPASWDEGDATLKPSIKKAGKVSKEYFD
ncbi:MAG: peroxiredoxin [Patescibacteria group bacterium]